MSEKVLKYCKNNEILIQKFKSDPNLTNYKTNNDEEDFEKILSKTSLKNCTNINMVRGKAMEKLNNSACLDLGVSLIKDTSQTDVSTWTNQIVSNALHIPRCLYCPFCAAEYMFEFTLKDHLKKIHLNEILDIAAQKKTVNEIYETHTCPFCSAVFYHFALVPLHLGLHHEPELLQEWQENTGNMNELKKKRMDCPSIEMIACSPAMSDLLKSLDISGRKCGKKDVNIESPKLKSILKKKTNMSGKIIFSPSSASLRRIGDDISKRNTSARRELRFELPPEEFDYSIQVTDPLYKLRESPPQKKKWGCFFSRDTNKNKVNIKPKNSARNNRRNVSQMVTSTPISLLSDDSVSLISTKKSKWKSIFTRSTKVPINSKDGFLPSFYASERYMCALCHIKFEDNAELLDHLRRKHNRFVNIMRSRYECGQCGKRFYKNNQLVRHCHYKHTPQKHRTSL